MNCARTYYVHLCVYLYDSWGRGTGRPKSRKALFIDKFPLSTIDFHLILHDKYLCLL